MSLQGHWPCYRNRSRYAGSNWAKRRFRSFGLPAGPADHEAWEADRSENQMGDAQPLPNYAADRRGELLELLMRTFIISSGIRVCSAIT